MHTSPRKLNPSCLCAFVVLFVLSCLAAATQPEEIPIIIVQPQVDKQAQSVKLPAYFWNLKLATWLDVCLCGRASDFLHETVVCVPTTKSLLLQAMRDAGFHDADYWAKDVHQFAQLRGDRFIILLTFTQNNKPETYSLDELLSFENWNSPAGPYGFMFKGDPERNINPPASAPAADDSPASQIIHDDPQIALTFIGIQHQSQSFADHPLAYDNWVYPPLKFGRNYNALPASTYDSNGKIPVSLTIQKVTEEELLTLSAKYAHTKSYADYILTQLPLARQIDEDKQSLLSQTPHPESTALLTARIVSNYAQLNAAWTQYAVDHINLITMIPQERTAIRIQSKRWLRHMDALADRARALCSYQANADSLADPSPLPYTIHAMLTSDQHYLRATILEAENAEVLDYWNEQLAQIDPATDPRSDYITSIQLNLEIAHAKNDLIAAEITLSTLYSTTVSPETTAANTLRSAAVKRLAIAQFQLDLFNLNFEIAKRQDTPNDPDLPKLLAQKSQLEKSLSQLQSTTQTTPATSP